MKRSKKKNIKKHDKVFTVLVSLTVILTITLAIMLFISRYNIDINSDKVTELFNYFNIKDLSNCNGLINYSDKLVGYKDIEEETRVCIAYNKANLSNIEIETLNVQKKKNTCKKDNMVFKSENDKTCEIKKISREVVDNNYKKMFGHDISEMETFRVDSNTICYLKDDYYYCGDSEVSVYTIGLEASIYRVIRDAKEKDGEVEIRDFFIKVNGKKCYSNYTTTTEIEECSKELSNDKKVDYNFMKKYGTQYKHTYKKAKNNTYYWVSSEPI